MHRGRLAHEDALVVPAPVSMEESSSVVRELQVEPEPRREHVPGVERPEPGDGLSRFLPNRVELRAARGLSRRLWSKRTPEVQRQTSPGSRCPPRRRRRFENHRRTCRARGSTPGTAHRSSRSRVAPPGFPQESIEARVDELDPELEVVIAPEEVGRVVAQLAVSDRAALRSREEGGRAAAPDAGREVVTRRLRVTTIGYVLSVPVVAGDARVPERIRATRCG